MRREPLLVGLSFSAGRLTAVLVATLLASALLFSVAAADEDTLTSAPLCAHKETGQLRLMTSGATQCLAQESPMTWTVGGEVTNVVVGQGLDASRRAGTVSVQVDEGIISAVNQDCTGEGPGSAIAALSSDGTVTCTSPRGIVHRLSAGRVVATGAAHLESCQVAQRASFVPNAQHATSQWVVLPPGEYRVLPGEATQFVGSPLTWRIDKTAFYDNPFTFYEGAVVATIQGRDIPDQPGSDPRQLTRFLRYFSSAGDGGHPDPTHELNVEDEDFGTFRLTFSKEVRLVMQAEATSCTWSEIGGSVSIERIG